MKVREIDNNWLMFLQSSVMGNPLAADAELFGIFCCIFDFKNSHLSEKSCYEESCYNIDSKQKQISKCDIVKCRGKEEISYYTFHKEVEKIYNHLDKKLNFESGKILFTYSGEKQQRRSKPLEDVWKWLKDEYPNWLKKLTNDFQDSTSDELWDRLREIGLSAGKKLNVEEIDPNSADSDTRQIKLKIIAEARSKIVVLTRDKEGISCVCPSKLARDTNLENQQLIISQKISNYSENQYWLWCIFNKVDSEDLEAEIELNLSWLNEASRFKNFQLKSHHLWELFTQVELQKADVFYANKNIGRSTSPSINIPENKRSHFEDPLFKAAISVLLQIPEYSDADTRKILNNWMSLSFSDQTKMIVPPESLEDLYYRFIDSEIFKTKHIAEEFLCKIYDKDDRKHIEEKRGKVNNISPNGKKLIKLINARIEVIGLLEFHRNAVLNIRTILKKGSIFEVREALRRLYDNCAKHYSQHQMRSFTVVDFDKDFWKNIVYSSQEDVIQKNHLHRANVVIGEKICEFLQKEFEDLPESDRKDRTLKIIEGGVGGLNTTCELIKHIVRRLDTFSSKTSIKEILYKGFDVHPAVAAFAESIITSSILVEDKRSQHFSRLQNQGKLRPLEPDIYSQFIFPDDMFDGIKKMYSEYPKNTIDVFVCSYALHHVPNGEALKNALFSADCDEDYRITRENNPKFFTGLEECLKQIKNGEELPENISPQVIAFLSNFLPAYETNGENTIDDALASIESGKDLRGEETPDWVEKSMLNRQHELLSMIHDMLRPNGLIAIADPDGFSKFNRDNVVTIPEMSVANFLSSDEIALLLKEIGFEILVNVTQVREGTSYDETGDAVKDDLNTNNDRYIDNNMGYIIIAKKREIK
jgi:hypothetical protein